MNALIDAALSRSRVVALALLMILVVGTFAYVTIPKESSPEVPIPTVYVSTTLDGVSPQDAERLIIQPLETELSSLEGLEEMTANAAQGYASVQLEFEPGYDSETALADVREAVDAARTDLPEDATEPVITEINTALFPIITAVLTGPLPERALNQLAKEARDALEATPGVLEVDIGGERTEMMEVLIDPTAFETYDLSFEDLAQTVSRNNALIAAGRIESGAGRLVLQVPGLIEDVQDVMGLPVKVEGNTVVTFADIATVRSTFEDPEGFARLNGQPAIALEIKKRVGANIIQTVADSRQALETLSQDWPDSLNVIYLQDQSEQVETTLADLQSNVIAAILLVMIVIIWALGLRSSILVGLAIPGAFLAGVAALWALGYTLNIVVLFSLILVVGMLVDGAIVVVELADRRLHDGDSPKEAYAHAAKRMAWPIISSTATTLSVFFPLLFWTGTVGEFMKFLPITVMLTLFASLLMALVFIPVVGGMIGRKQPQTAGQKALLTEAGTGDPRSLGGATGAYVRLLERAILRPGMTVLLAVALLLASFAAYGQLGRGIAFFPEVEPEQMQVTLRARDSFSIYEQDALVRTVEDRLLDYPEIANIYARTGSTQQQDSDIIGTLQLELVDWNRRATAAHLGARIREQMRDVAGITVQVETQSGGPTEGRPINLQISAPDPLAQQEAVNRITAAMEEMGGFTDISTTLPPPGVEWLIKVDRQEAARYGADITLLGQAVQLVTQGITVSEYRPPSAEEEVDIRVRFPAEERTLENLQALRVPTSVGLVPLTNFVTFSPAPRTGTLIRIDQQRVVTIEADVAEGVLVNDQVIALTEALNNMGLPGEIGWTFGGEAEDQAEASIFLALAFVSAVALMFTVLLTQFNSFYESFVVMSAIVFSVAGVLVGLLITGRPFGAVMGGIGVISLAGIVVNNNIVLIDTFKILKAEGMSPREAALRTGAQRLRPVLLTSLTTALGLLPMVIGINIDFFGRRIVYGAPSTQWWTELSAAIAGGLLVATVLTLIVTPAMLMLRETRGLPLAPVKNRRSMRNK